MDEVKGIWGRDSRGGGGGGHKYISGEKEKQRWRRRRRHKWKTERWRKRDLERGEYRNSTHSVQHIGSKSIVAKTKR